MCWDDTPAGTITSQNCPNYFPDFDPTGGWCRAAAAGPRPLPGPETEACQLFDTAGGPASSLSSSFPPLVQKRPPSTAARTASGSATRRPTGPGPTTPCATRTPRPSCRWAHRRDSAPAPQINISRLTNTTVGLLHQNSCRVAAPIPVLVPIPATLPMLSYFVFCIYLRHNETLKTEKLEEAHLLDELLIIDHLFRFSELDSKNPNGLPMGPGP